MYIYLRVNINPPSRGPNRGTSLVVWHTCNSVMVITPDLIYSHGGFGSGQYSGQVVHTPVGQSQSSIILYRWKRGFAMYLERPSGVTHCVYVAYPPAGSVAWERDI